MNSIPDPKAVAREVIEILGGREACLTAIDDEISQKQDRWELDIEAIGRILRAHLYVEHYLEEYLIHTNPRLGTLKDARLTFAQKVALVDHTDARVVSLLPGLKVLNKVRNRLAHDPQAIVTTEDVSAFLQDPFFKALRSALAHPNPPSTEPIEILEEFARHAEGALTRGRSRLTVAFQEAHQRLVSANEAGRDSNVEPHPSDP
jgi:hypothetical protein